MRAERLIRRFKIPKKVGLVLSYLRMEKRFLIAGEIFNTSRHENNVALSLQFHEYYVFLSCSSVTKYLYLAAVLLCHYTRDDSIPILLGMVSFLTSIVFMDIN